jgi:L-glyceraldehyde 3-phosphate reductase
MASESIFLNETSLDADTMVKIKALNQHAEQRGQSLAQMALAWLLSRKQVTSVLIGASSVDQLKANAATLYNLSFSGEELAYIDNILL